MRTIATCVSERQLPDLHARIRGLPNTTLALGVRRTGGVITLVITRARIEV